MREIAIPAYLVVFFVGFIIITSGLFVGLATCTVFVETPNGIVLTTALERLTCSFDSSPLLPLVNNMLWYLLCFMVAIICAYITDSYLQRRKAEDYVF